jgi:NAD(P)-dependent dehydrogenase (short-subunit alcohol dehydrogenase family)
MKKTAMIWGASGGIGRALTAKLVDEGWTVLALSRHPQDLQALTPHTIAADVSDPASVEAAVEKMRQQTDAIDLWIYAAGDITAQKVDALSPEDWARILDANLNGAYLTVHYSLPLLANDAHLVFLGAISERLRLPGLAAYAASKAGLEAFADTLRKEQRKRRVTVVRPAAIATPLWDKVPMQLPKKALTPKALAQHILDAYEQGHKGTLDLTH